MYFIFVTMITWGKLPLRVLNQVISTTPVLYTAMFNSTGTDFDESFPGDIRNFADTACEA